MCHMGLKPTIMESGLESTNSSADSPKIGMWVRTGLETFEIKTPFLMPRTADIF